MIQRGLFDKRLGELARDRAIERVGEAAPLNWMFEALKAVRYLAQHSVEFTTDAVWAMVSHLEKPPEPRAMGAVMSSARALRLVAPTDRFELSKRPACHRRPLRVWQALLRPKQPLKREPVL